MTVKSIVHIAHERQIINQSIRSFFVDRGYTEVETPIVVRSPGMEPNLVPFETMVIEPNGVAHTAALITSPEYFMKKLLGLGMQKIFTITKVFRNEESFGGNHNPEFSMIERYQKGAEYHVCMHATTELITSVAQNLSLHQCSINQDVFLTDWKHVRVQELFLEYLGLDLSTASSEQLRQTCMHHHIHCDASDTESDFFYRLFLSKIEPELRGKMFVVDYPKYQASLARLTLDQHYGERFELYLNGLEICNGFTELTDSQEQRSRFLEEAKERATLNRTVHPIDETFLNLLPSLQIPTFGNALGIDRLHMFLMNRDRIEDVMLFSAQDLF